MIIKIKNISQQLVSNPLALILTLLVISEFVYKICIKEYFHAFKISAWLKITLQGFFIIQIIRHDYKKLLPILGLALIFFLGQIGLVPWEQFQKNGWFFDKYLFVLLALLYVQTLENAKQYYPLFFKVFEVFIIVNSVCIFLGLLLPTDYFNTYFGNNKRFGLNGLILRSGAATYIYWIALFYYVTECFVLKKRKWLQLAVVLVASLLLGTKAMAVGLFFIALYLWIHYQGYKKKWHWAVLIIVVVIIGIYFTDILVWIFSKSDTLNSVYQERGLFSALVSLRDQHLIEELVPLIQEKWTWRNYIFGGGFDMHYRSQFGILDLLYFFGILGAAAYLLIFRKLFVTFTINKITILFLTGTFVLMAFSANFFYETIMAIYLVLIKGYFETIQEKISNK